MVVVNLAASGLPATGQPGLSLHAASYAQSSRRIGHFLVVYITMVRIRPT